MWDFSLNDSEIQPSIVGSSVPGTDLRPCINQGTKQDCYTVGERKFPAMKGDLCCLLSVFDVKILGLELVVLLQIGQIS